MLIDLLRTLPATGGGSLEYLVGQLMASAFRMKARPEASGYQAGRDIALYDLETGKPTGVEIEVKRYAKASGPPERDLVGEARQVVSNRPEVYLWVIVSTARITARKSEEVQKTFEDGATEFKLVDTGEDGIGYLEVLVARERNVAFEWLRKNHEKALPEWTAAIDAVTADPVFSIHSDAFLKYIHGRYHPRNARPMAQAWLAKHLDDRSKAVPRLNQYIGRQDRAPNVQRPRIDNEALAWLDKSEDRARMLAFLGEEGDGKTWSALTLLRAAEDRTPLVATANMFDDGGAASLLAQALANQCGGDEDDWRTLVETKPEAWFAELNILLLLDGLNEAPRFHYANVLSELLQLPWGKHLDIVITCRQAFWESRVETFLYPLTSSVHPIDVGPFDWESEWPQARKLLGPTVASLPGSLLTALRNPRLWSFAYDLREHLGGLGEITLERLLIEHWRLRLQQRSRYILSPIAFNQLVAKAVKGVVPGLKPNNVFFKGELEDFLGQIGASAENFDVILGEISGGIFFETTGQEKLRLRPERILIALGLLLAQDLMDALDCDPQPKAARDVIGDFLLDLPAKDELEIILRSAVLAFLSKPSYRTLALPPLLRHWVALQNRSGDFDRALCIVAAASPDDLIQAIEDEASEDEFVEESASRLVTALIQRRDNASVYRVMLGAATRWLGSYSNISCGDIDPRQADGATSSDIRSIQDLYNYAAHFMAHLHLEDWHEPLLAWAGREIAIARSVGRASAMDLDIRWLGMSEQMTDAAAQEILVRVTSAVRSNADTAVILVSELLNGFTFEKRKRRGEEAAHSAVRHGETRSSRHVTVHYSDAYPEVPSQSGNGWSAIEANLLAESPDALRATIEAFQGEVAGVLQAGQMVPSLAQFVNDNGLYLRGASIDLVRQHLLNRSLADRPHDEGLFPPGGALPAIFVASEPAKHVETLIEMAALSGVDTEVVNLAGLAPSSDEQTLAIISDALSHGGGSRMAALDVLARLPAEAEIGEDLQKHLVSIALGPKCLHQARALGILAARGSLKSARQIASSEYSAADVYGLLGPRDISALIVRGTPDADYSSLRRRVALPFLARAAANDGTPLALKGFVEDFAALLSRTGGAENSLWKLAADFNDLALTRAQPVEKSALVDASLKPLVLNRDEMVELLKVLVNARPSAIEDLSAWIDGLSDLALSELEGKIALVTALAAHTDVERTRAWVKRLPLVRPMSEFEVPRLPSLFVFAFDASRADLDQLRDDIAEQAWTDGQLCDICAAAEAGACHDWLEKWIEAGAQSESRSKRVRAIILRGWRGAKGDLEILACENWPTGYESYAAAGALERARNRRRMAVGLTAYKSARDDDVAWRAYRQVLQIADRRLILLTRQSWIKTLSRSRRAYHEVMAGEFEWFIKRNEAGIAHAFAYVNLPTSIPPWNRIELYSRQLELSRGG